MYHVVAYIHTMLFSQISLEVLGYLVMVPNILLLYYRRSKYNIVLRCRMIKYQNFRKIYVQKHNTNTTTTNITFYLGFIILYNTDICTV